MSDNNRVRIFVVGATGRQGKGAIDALLSLPNTENRFEIFGITRNNSSDSAKAFVRERNVTLFEANLGDYDSLVKALRKSKATRAILVTDYFSSNSEVTEVKQGTNFLKAVEEVNPGIFVLYSSACDAEKAHNVPFFRSKAAIEEELKSSAIRNWFILRPTPFFENWDHPKNWNPLKKGQVKFLTRVDTKVKFVSIADVGNAIAKVIGDDDPAANFHGQSLQLATEEFDGYDIAKVLTEASGVTCTYSPQMPRLLLRLFLSDLYQMVLYFEKEGQSASIKESRMFLPNALDAKAWFESKDVAAWKV